MLDLPDAHESVNLVIGRFRRASAMSACALSAVIDRQPAVVGKPVLRAVDFGHTSPMITFPGGCRTALVASERPYVVSTLH